MKHTEGNTFGGKFMNFTSIYSFIVAAVAISLTVKKLEQNKINHFYATRWILIESICCALQLIYTYFIIKNLNTNKQEIQSNFDKVKDNVNTGILDMYNK